MNVYTLTEIFEKSKLYIIIILRFETIQRKSVFRRVMYSTNFFTKDEDLWEEKQKICQGRSLVC